MTAVGTVPPSATAALDARRLVAVIGLTLALAYAVFLAGSLMQGYWLVDAQGRAVASDFVGIWSAGYLALQGNAASAYDWAVHGDVAAAAVGHPLETFYPWLYPPTFLFAASLIALVPIVPAAVLWLALTVPAYVAAIRAIVGGRAGVLIACGCPGALWAATAGQSGFLTTALVGASLSLMERQPLAAGLCLGLLTFKPQFGLLFPVVLALTGRWRVFAAASVVALLMAGASALVFGTAAWDAFARTLPAASHLNFVLGGPGWAKWQSLYGAVRWLGGGELLAWAIHLSVAIAVAALVCGAWLARLPFELKAAALATGALIATPYLFIYDLVVLAVPMAFLLRLGFSAGFLWTDVAGLAAAGALLLGYILAPSPVGLLAVAAIGVTIGARILREVVPSPSS